MSDPLVVMQWVEPGVAVIEIRRQAALNALNGDVLYGLEQALEAVEANSEAHVGIVTGKGRGPLSRVPISAPFIS